MHGISGIATCVSGKVDFFIYRGGPNQFQPNFPKQTALDTGNLRQDFDENDELPNVDSLKLLELDILGRMRRGISRSKKLSNGKELERSNEQQHWTFF